MDQLNKGQVSADSLLSADKNAELTWQQTLMREAIGFGHALFVALLLRTFLYQPFIIPSESMYPTLEVGDFIFVNKFVYGYSNRSFSLFSWTPNLVENRVLKNNDLKRGDVVVFHNPKHTNEQGKPDPIDYIKRLIGVPGDRVQMIDGVLHINGEAAKIEQMDDYQMIDAKDRFQISAQYMETLPGGVKHRILKSIPMGRGWLDNTEEYVVPAGHYFFMGDNRDNSKDSRVLDAVGYIPEKDIIGRADMVLLTHRGHLMQPWTWLNLRFDRPPHFID